MILIGMCILINSAIIRSRSIYFYAFLVGTGMGAAYVCMATTLGNYYGPRYFASIMETAFPMMFIPASLGPFLAGFVYDHYGSYTNAFYGQAILSFMGSLIISFAKPPVRIMKSTLK